LAATKALGFAKEIAFRQSMARKYPADYGNTFDSAGGPSVSPLTPEKFGQYKVQIQEKGSWSACQHSKLWTPIALSAAESIYQQFNLQTARAYFRVDVVGSTGTWNNPLYDYDFKVAFEAEYGSFWEDELCKLAHIVSDLQVLLAYQSSKNRRAETVLHEHLARHKSRVVRNCHCRWLFMFGPHPKKSK
jgi:hypothetical protein